MAVGAIVFILSLLLAILIFLALIQFWSTKNNNTKVNGKVFFLLSVLLTIPLFYTFFPGTIMDSKIMV